MKNQPLKKISILVVDDSYVSQKLYRHLLESDGRFQIMGFVNNGKEAVEFLRTNTPDIISMDINMPLMDGMEATRHIMQSNPTPIVIVSSLYDPSQQEMAMEALEAGAVAIMPKPHGPGNPLHEKTAKHWLRMIRSMSEVKVIRRRPHLKNNAIIEQKENRQNIKSSKYQHANYRIVVIGASAGGPEGVKTILSKLTPSFPIPVLIVQHIDKHFTEGYRLWLQSFASIPVFAATKNQPLLPGSAYLTPGEYHLVVKSEGLITLNDDPPVRGHKPSVAKLFDSAADVYGQSVIAVMLSGMGADGAKELKKLHDMGALTFAQSEESCLVFGMPGEAVRLGAIIKINNPENIATEILELFK